MTNLYRVTNKPGQRDASTTPNLGREPDRTPQSETQTPIRGLSAAEIREIVRDLLG